jgi:hypothetical protein
MRSEIWTTRARVGLVNSHPNAVAKSNSCPLKGVCIFDGARERAQAPCAIALTRMLPFESNRIAVWSFQLERGCPKQT